MSPELETLDQLLGGALALAIIRGCYPDHDRFVRGVSGLLANGDVKLLVAGGEVPKWRWAEILNGVSPKDGPVLALTEKGAARIA